MTTTLTLTGGTESIDFISGSEFKLVQDGLGLPPPELLRVMGGDPLLAEGRSLQARRFGNREISIRFKSLSATHNALAASLGKLQRILNYAVRAQQSQGIMAQATLQLKLDTQSNVITFDILDGEIKLSGPLNEILRRQGPFLENEIVLEAKPYARGATVRLENFLINPGFDINPAETGRDTGYYITFGSAGQRLERANITGLSNSDRAQFLAGTWAYPKGTSGDEQVIMKVGGVWEVTFRPDDRRYRFRMADAASNIALVTSSQTYNINEWHHVQCLALQIEGAFPQQLLMLVINRKLAGVMRHTLGTLLTTGKFVLGADESDTRWFNGRISGAYILVKNIWPWQLRFLFDHGMRSLVRGTAGDASGTPPGSDYWDLTDAEYGGVWVFDQSSGDILDSGPNGRTLTLVGSPTYTQNQRQPKGWTVSGTGGTVFLSIVNSPRKYGPFSLYIHKTTALTFPIIQQTVTIPSYKRGTGANLDWEFSFWAQPLADGTADFVHVRVQGDVGGTYIDTDLDLLAGMNQYGCKITANVADTTLTVSFRYKGSTTAMDLYIANTMLLPGSPFGLGTSLAQLTTPTPWISSRFLVGTPQFSNAADNAKDRKLRVFGLPGDEPLSTRVFVENPK